MYGNYNLDQYISVGIYMIGMAILFAIIGLFSAYLTNKYFKKNKLYQVKKKSKRKKKWFYDVA